MAVDVDRHRSGASALDGIRHQHFLLGNLAAAPSDEPLDRIDRFHRLENTRVIRRLADDRRGARRGEMDD